LLTRLEDLDEGDGSVVGVEIGVITSQNAGTEDDGVLVGLGDVVDSGHLRGSGLKVQSEFASFGLNSVHLRSDFNLGVSINDEFNVGEERGLAVISTDGGGVDRGAVNTVLLEETNESSVEGNGDTDGVLVKIPDKTGTGEGVSHIVVLETLDVGDSPVRISSDLSSDVLLEGKIGVESELESLVEEDREAGNHIEEVLLGSTFETETDETDGVGTESFS
jgi:hypothetical protein